MSPNERERTLGNVALLRQAEKGAASPDIVVVREDLESQLGGTVSRSLAARFLGLSHTALNNWIKAGDFPSVISKNGRKEVPIRALLDLRERVEEQRREGRRLHLLEPAMVEGRRRAEQMRPRVPGPGGRQPADPHRKAELRSLAYHRAVAPLLRRPMVEEAERKLARWVREGRIDRRHARAWEEVFSLPMTAIRKAIAADDERGHDLRQNSPLAGMLSEPERRKILAKVS
jgi:hypothetical protein